MLKLAPKPEETRVPPHSLEAERAVLGSVLIRPSAMDDVTTVIASGDDFFLPAHREVFEAMKRIVAKGKPLDVLTLVDEIGPEVKRLEGGPAYLLDVSNSVPTAENAGHYARIVRDKAVLRRLIATCAETMSRAYGDVEASELLAEHRQQVSGLEIGGEGGPVKLGDGLPGALDAIEDRARNPSGHAVMTGIREFDEKIGGYREAQAIVVAARPGKGKSSYALNTAVRAAEAGVPGLVFSLEMSFQELAERTISFRGSVEGHVLASGKTTPDDWTRITVAEKKLRDLPLWLDDRNLTIASLCSEARRWRARHAPGGLALIAVDYLGLIRHVGKGGTRNDEVAQMSRELKLLAKELKCPVMVVSQLNRENEKGGDGPRKPRLSDLRDSGAVEQDADMVIFPWREADSSPSRGMVPATLIVAKHRGGPVGEIDVEWDGRYMAFYDAEGSRG